MPSRTWEEIEAEEQVERKRRFDSIVRFAVLVVGISPLIYTTWISAIRHERHRAALEQWKTNRQRLVKDYRFLSNAANSGNDLAYQQSLSYASEDLFALQNDADDMSPSARKTHKTAYDELSRCLLLSRTAFVNQSADARETCSRLMK